jgi:hypothetical protein
MMNGQTTDLERLHDDYLLTLFLIGKIRSYLTSILEALCLRTEK